MLPQLGNIDEAEERTVLEFGFGAQGLGKSSAGDVPCRRGSRRTGPAVLSPGRFDVASPAPSPRRSPGSPRAVSIQQLIPPRASRAARWTDPMCACESSPAGWRGALPPGSRGNPSGACLWESPLLSSSALARRDAFPMGQWNPRCPASRIRRAAPGVHSRPRPPPGTPPSREPLRSARRVAPRTASRLASGQGWGWSICVADGNELYAWGPVPTARDPPSDARPASASAPPHVSLVPVPGGCQQASAWRSTIVACNASGELFQVPTRHLPPSAGSRHPVALPRAPSR